MKQKPFFVRLTLAAILAFFLYYAVYPLLCMFANLTAADASSLFASGSFWRACRATLIASGLTTILSMLLALAMALLLLRTDACCKTLWQIFFIVPMLVPSVSEGAGLILLFGNNGVLTRLFHLPFSLYGIQGIVLGHILYTAPIAFLLLSTALRRQDYTPHEAAAVLGVTPLHRFWRITLPAIRREGIAAAFLVFALSAADFGVPALLGGKVKTLASIMYAQVEGQLQFGKGSVIGVCLLIPAIFSFLADSASRRSAKAFVIHPFPIRKGPVRKFFATSACVLLALLFALPAATCTVIMLLEDYPLHMQFTLRHLGEIWSAQGAAGMRNSLLLALGTALFGTLTALLAAYGASRHRGILPRLVHLAAVTSMTVPGLVLGLAYILAFKTAPFYGTLGILIFSSTIHFFTTPYLMLYQTMTRFHQDLESVGATLGIPPFRLFTDVLLPQCAGPLLDAANYFFLNAMVTISAVSFLSNQQTRPLSLLISQYSSQINPEAAAALTFLIMVVNLLVRGAVALLRRRVKT